MLYETLFDSGVSLTNKRKVVRHATGWTVRDRIPVGAIFSALVQTAPGAYPASYTMGTGCLSRG